MPHLIKNNNLHSLLELATLLNAQTDFNETLRLAARKACAIFHAEVALILMVNPRTRQTMKTIQREGPGEAARQYKKAQLQISGWLMIHKKPLLVENAEKDERFSNAGLAQAGIRSAVGVPLHNEGVFIGTMILLNKTNGEIFEAADLQALEQLSVIAAPHLRNVQKIQDYFEVRLPKKALLRKYAQVGLLGRSKKFIELLESVDAAARCDVRVLLEGESGTGKELVARAIHIFSDRHAKPFVAIDCGAMQANLIESELFGHERGAFTGATTSRKGLFEAANGGTLFIDEIANMPLDMQAKLMRVLQEGEVRPVGSNETRDVDVRVIAASSKSLRELVDNEVFREDLFYRLHVYPIFISSLDARREDIPLLATHFLQKYAVQHKKQLQHFSEEMIDFISRRKWPGNIRELENFVERLIALAKPAMKIISPEVLPLDMLKAFKRAHAELSDAQFSKSLEEKLQDSEAQLIHEALQATDWNKSRAARLLKIPTPTLRYKMKKYGI
ncbi:MAG: sigma 54-interacting transcriptional regulator [bacterium]